MGQSKLILFFLRVGQVYGNIWFYLLLSLCSFFFGFSWGIFLISSLVLGVVLTAAIRIIYFKDRPNPKRNLLFLSTIRASSFPSGHVQRPVFLLFFFQSFSYLFLLLGILGLVLVVFQRFEERYHDFYDLGSGVVLGIVIGVFIKTLVF